MNSLFAFALGFPEMIVIGVIGVLLFGRKLPDVGRYLGKSITEFKKGVKGLEDDMDPGFSAGSSHSAPAEHVQARPPQRVAATAPKFEDAPPQV